MKKKNVIYLIIAIVLVVISVFVILYENGVFRANGKSGPSSTIFAIEDTSRVSKIFLADMHGNTVLLTKTPHGWTVNDSLTAMPEKIGGILSTMQNIRVRQSVAKTAQNNVNSVLSINSVKVEIYEKKPLFTIFGIKFFDKERKTKSYYMGPATQDNVANFAYLEGTDEPYIVHIPGFRGFLTPQYSQFPLEWITHRIFETKITRIQTAEFKDFENPEESFRVEKTGPRFFDLYDYKNERIMDWDTIKMIDMLSEFRNKNFEYIETSLSREQVDSVLKFNLFKIITVTDVEGKTTEAKLYRRTYDGGISLSEFQDIDPSEFDWDLDRFYAIVDGDESTLYSMQYFHFDRQVQPLSYFLNKDE